MDPSGPTNEVLPQSEPAIEVPLQSPFTGPGVEFVISPEKAAEKCENIGPDQLLLELNRLSQTNYKMQDSGVEKAIQECILNKYDFGTAYGRLRLIWTSGDIPRAQKDVLGDAADIEQRKKRAFTTDENGHVTIIHPYMIPPRRVWDLYSHRVVPFHFVKRQQYMWAISHSWMASNERTTELTPVNGFEWPVPLPRGVTIERIRNEMLNLGAEYCWLDILCLRQKSSGPGEKLRDGEWAIDVPTLGNVYVGAATVVRYYNGLGVPFKLGGLDGDRHWVNRAWTLQEIKDDTRIGGIPLGIPAPPVTGQESHDGEDPYLELSKRISPLTIISRGSNNLMLVAGAMQHRTSSNLTDKVFGLGYLLRVPHMPTYHEGQSEEQAWWALVQCLTDHMRSELLFLFPEPGLGDHKWLPSWSQMLTAVLSKEKDMFEQVKIRADGCVTYRGHVAEKCDIQGMELIIESGGMKSTFSIYTRHKSKPPQGSYTIVGDTPLQYLVVCKPRADETEILEKISVVQLKSESREGYNKLGVIKYCVFR